MGRFVALFLCLDTAPGRAKAGGERRARLPERVPERPDLRRGQPRHLRRFTRGHGTPVASPWLTRRPPAVSLRRPADRSAAMSATSCETVGSSPISQLVAL